MSDPLTAAQAANYIAAVETKSNSNVESTASVVKLPQKRYFRQRAHANPFSDHLLE